jgi:hypothetical protein
MELAPMLVRNFSINQAERSKIAELPLPTGI